MYEEITLLVLIVSVLTLLYSFTAIKKPAYSRKEKKSSVSSPSPLKDYSEVTDDELLEEEHGGPDIYKRTYSESMPSIAGERMEDSAGDIVGAPPDFDSVRASGPRDRTLGAAQIIERKASLIYWERMCLEEEFDLIVSLHRPDFKIKTPEGSSVHESDETYKLPKTGHVRVIPVCSGCNISPAYRDMKVSELDNETRGEFKVLPLKEGNYDLNVEFQVVNADGSIQSLGTESTEVHIQKKPIDLNIGALNISVSRKVPAFFSMCGSFFGLTSFVLARLGINLNEEILAWSATISTGLAGGVMILLALMLLIKGIKPLMREISITFN